MVESDLKWNGTVLENHIQTVKRKGLVRIVRNTRICSRKG